MMPYHILLQGSKLSVCRFIAFVCIEVSLLTLAGEKRPSKTEERKIWSEFGAWKQTRKKCK